MKDEILIIPDVHGLDYWKKPCENWGWDIIFLGDYVDPYYPVSDIAALQNLKDIVEFSKKKECIFLLGNHDFSYLTGFGKCRYNYEDQEEIKSLLESLKLKIYAKARTPNGDYLFSHAGFTNGWLSTVRPDILFLNDYTKITEQLEQVPQSRGGMSKYGSCIWNSMEDFCKETHNRDGLSNTYQIFGHTWGSRTKPVVASDFAMLDCHKAFILNLKTGKIREYGKD